MNLLRGNDGERVRRNPADVQGKLRGGGDLTGDEERQAEIWEELVAETEGRTPSRMDTGIDRDDRDDRDEVARDNERQQREREGEREDRSTS